MINVANICQTVQNFFARVRPPAPDISKVLTVCAGANRVGLSAIQSTSKIVKDLEKLGIPTGNMPDGSVNLTVGMTYATVKEIQRATKEDMKTDVGLLPGSLNIQVGNLFGTNVNTGEGKSISS